MNKKTHSTQTVCRSCGGSDLRLFLDLGVTPLADRLLTREQLKQPEPVYPLQVAFCADCSLVQVLQTVPPEVLFCEDYPYYSSVSPALLEHTKKNVSALIASRKLGPQSFVVEIASNDGYLLKNYVQQGIPCLGVDPAEGPAGVAQKAGVPTLCTFFDVALARKLVAEGKRADVVHANNVLAHVPDTNGFVEGIAALLKPDGVAVIEAPYLRDLVEHCEFDTIYHEHLCYFSVTALDKLFRRHSLHLNHVERLSIHGGSLRLFVEPKPAPRPVVDELLQAESRDGVDTLAFYNDFARRVEGIRTSLLDLLTGLKSSGKVLAAYGAAAKGSTLINYAGVGTELIDFVVDRNVHKHGKYMPGKHIPIHAPAYLVEKMPDYTLLLSWNFAEEILKQQEAYTARGGRFIRPVPVPKVM